MRNLTFLERSVSVKHLEFQRRNSQCEGTTFADEVTHRDYWKKDGKLIHLSKYSRPEICNQVRELARFGIRPTMAHFKAMMRCMKFCVNTKTQTMKITPGYVSGIEFLELVDTKAIQKNGNSLLSCSIGTLNEIHLAIQIGKLLQNWKQYAQ